MMGTALGSDRGKEMGDEGRSFWGKLGWAEKRVEGEEGERGTVERTVWYRERELWLGMEGGNGEGKGKV